MGRAQSSAVILVASLCFAAALDGAAATLSGSSSAAQLPFWDLYTSFCDWKHVRVDATGQSVDLILDQLSAAAFGSINYYYGGHLSIQIKLPGGNSAGTVTAFYASSDQPNHDEFDFELLGNVTGEPYILQTNVYVAGEGNREMRHFLWFDPTADFHTYSIFWNSHMLIFYVDSIPLRVFMNNSAKGIKYPTKPVKVFSSVWDGSTWATNGGRTPLNWTCAPFTAAYAGLDHLDGCKVWNGNLGPCEQPQWWDAPQYQQLNPNQKNLLKWVESYEVYNYCTDVKRFPKGIPPECNLLPY